MINHDENIKQIYNEFKPKIVRYLTRLVGEYDAEDLSQEVFAKVNAGLASFRHESNLSTWIYKIATNIAIDKSRSPSFKRKLESLPEDDDLVGELAIEQKGVTGGGNELTADQKIVRDEMNGCIRSFIEDLPESHRSVLILSELEGFKNQEIADILGISLENVKIRLHRARMKLKLVLQKNCSFYRNDDNNLSCDRKL